MRLFKYFLLLFTGIFLFCFSHHAYSQAGPIGSWNSFLSYATNKSLTLAGKNIYVGGISGLFSVNTETHEIHKYNTVQGLTELNVEIVKYDAADKALFIAYTSTNIDILFQRGGGNTLPEDFEKVNMVDIYRKVVIGTKEIHDVYFNSGLAYISTSFGIVVYDMKKREVKDSYLNIGPGATVPDVYGITINGTKIYASTSTGILEAPLNSNLLDYNSWTTIHPGPGGAIASFNNIVYALADSMIMSYNGTAWTVIDGRRIYTSLNFDVNNNRLLIARPVNNFILVNASGAMDSSTLQVQYPVMALLSDDAVWMIPQNLGLMTRSISTGHTDFIAPSGPKTNDVFSLEYSGHGKDRKMLVMCGKFTPRLEPTYSNAGFYSIEKYEAKYYQGPNQNAFDTIRDCIVSATSADGSHTYIGTFGYGMLELVNDNLTNVYSMQAPSFFNVRPATAWGPKIMGLAFDSKQNLWISNMLSSSRPVYVKTPAGEWHQFTINNVLGSRDVIGKVVVDQDDIKWITTFESNGLIAFKENNLNDPDNVNVRWLNDQPGQGALASKDVQCVAVDHDGEVWVGTANGISVFSSPGRVFDQDAPDSRTPYVREGSVGVPLLQYQTVTCIEIDGANRKWIGTKNGLWLFNVDGSKPVVYFNTDNCPLYSNNIIDLELDPESGELYIATDKGLIIFKTDAVEGGEEFGDVYAYPNPVRPGYTGPIAIKGLISDCTVKITDMAGNLVFETVSLGGQAIWDGNDFNGNRAHSGVYMVFASNKDGSKHFQTKIAIVN
jgi:hypothetical protein